jgi:hypothetical protein
MQIAATTVLATRQQQMGTFGVGESGGAPALLANSLGILGVKNF